MRRYGWLVVSLGVFAGSSGASPARGETPEQAAEKLFDEAKLLTDAGRYAEACPKLEASERLDPALGTEFNLADCYEHTGRRARAYGLFRAAAGLAKRTGRAPMETKARARAEALASLVAHVRVHPPSSPVGLEVRVDGALARGEDPGGVVVEPGSHEVVATAPEYAIWRTGVTVDRGATLDVSVPPLTPLGTAPPEGEAPAPPPPREPPRGHGMKTAAVVVGAAGILGIGIGAGLGFVALAQHNVATGTACKTPMTVCHDAAGRDAWSSATKAGTGSTIAFAIGAAALATGIVLWVLAPSSNDAPPSATARLRAGLGGVSIEGAF